jgi:hypothetical protein
VTGNSDLIVPAPLGSLIGGMEATGHEAEAKFQKKTPQYQIHPALPDLEHAKAVGPTIFSVIKM